MGSGPEIARARPRVDKPPESVIVDKAMIEFLSLGHINVIVDDIDDATAFYERAFGAVALQSFPHFKNIGFSKSAGFMSHPEDVDVSIRFLELPTRDRIWIELMNYHSPHGRRIEHRKETNDSNCLGHVCLKVKSAQRAFEHLKALGEGRFISADTNYGPYKIDSIEPTGFYFHDAQSEDDAAQKKEVCDTIGNIRFFYFVDPYGIQWELEEGH
jgi:methylmalonyl-CoA/ethylmalonyl-CoA epimerase